MKAGFLILAIAVMAVFSQDSTKGKNFSWGGGIDLSQFSVGKSFFVKNVSYEMRNVPIHSGDGGVAGPITRTNYEIDADYDPSLFVFYSFKTFTTVQVSLGFCLALGYDIAERNYTNDVGGTSRETGAALTYCEFSNTGIFPQIGLELPRVIHYSESDNSGFGIGLGCSLIFQSLDVDNGWDRFSAFEGYQEEKLANLFPLEVYVKFSFLQKDWQHVAWRYSFLTGIRMNNFYQLTPAGKEMGVGANNISWFCSLAIFDFIVY